MGERVRITDVDVVLHSRSSSLAVFGVSDGKLPMGVLRITTDEGIVGHNFLSYPGPGPAAIADQIITFASRCCSGRTRSTSAAIGAVSAGWPTSSARSSTVSSTSRSGTSPARRPGCRSTACSARAATALPCTSPRAIMRGPRTTPTRRATGRSRAGPATSCTRRGRRGSRRPRRRSGRHGRVRGRPGRRRARDGADARLLVELLLHAGDDASAAQSRSSTTSGTRTRCRRTTSTAMCGSSSICTSRCSRPRQPPVGSRRWRRGSPPARPTSCAATS